MNTSFKGGPNWTNRSCHRTPAPIRNDAFVGRMNSSSYFGLLRSTGHIRKPRLDSVYQRSISSFESSDVMENYPRNEDSCNKHHCYMCFIRHAVQSGSRWPSTILFLGAAFEIPLILTTCRKLLVLRRFLAITTTVHPLRIQFDHC